MLEVLIVEDNRRGADLLKKRLLEHFSDKLSIIDAVGTIEEAVEVIKKQKPKLIFLDIHLTDGDGFEVLEHTSSYDYDVIFTTAYSDYSLKAFDYAALHYLLKPIDEKELVEAVQRFLARQSIVNLDQVQVLKNLLNPETTQIAIPSAGEVAFIDANNIVCIEADSNYSTIHLIDKQQIVSTKPLLFYDDLLSSKHFYRIHGKYLINTNCVVKYIRGKGGSVILTNGAELPVSVRKKAGFMNKMMGM